MGSSILHILQESEKRLLGVDSPRLSAEVIVAEVLDCSRLSLVVDHNRVVNEDEKAVIESMVARREKGEPLAYILGRKEFYGLDFIVTPDTLIPRPETEHIIEKVEELYSMGAAFRFADLGTGSGILAVTLAHRFKKASGIAVDLSSGALKTALENSRVHSVDDRLEFRLGDFTKPLFETETFDLIVSNPPYVPQHEYDDASYEVTDYEPETALVSGEDGLDHVRAMMLHVAKAVRSGGHVLIEIGYQQGRAVVQMVADNYSEFTLIEVIKDLSGHDRIVWLSKA